MKIADDKKSYYNNSFSSISCEWSFHFHFIFHFHTFKEGGPSANAGLQGALHLHYNISNTKQKNIYIK